MNRRLRHLRILSWLSLVPVVLLLGSMLLLGGCATKPQEPPPGPGPAVGATAGQARRDAPLAAGGTQGEQALARQVEIRRTSYGVPHILASNLEAAAFGLAWVMMEDYGEEVPRQLLRANGRWSLVEGPRAVDGDFPGQMAHQYAAEVLPAFPQDVQAMLRGFAAGVNHFIRTRPDQLPAWAEPGFSAQDIAARDLSVWDQGAADGLLERRAREARTPRIAESHAGGSPNSSPDECAPGHADCRGVRGEALQESNHSDIGSNAWAFGPERTRSGRAILVRNPHLSYTSGYYEAHVTVPGVLNFYGDFRLGGPFTIIGGFNDRLGWATTNNSPQLDQVYALLKDPADPDAYLFDGESVPLGTREVTVEYVQDSVGQLGENIPDRQGPAGRYFARDTRRFRFSPLGPVLLETPDTVFVLKTPALGQIRLGEQWLRMMQAQTLDEWKAAMRIRAKYSSNFTYADADGNIYMVWNASLPVLPHEPSDGAPVFAEGRADVWQQLVPWDDLPQFLNPRGGYVQNSNDPPYYTNMNEPLDPHAFAANFPEPRLRLRTQNSLELIDTDRVMSLEEVVELKHSMKMLLADRVKGDLLSLLGASDLEEGFREAADLLGAWDNRATRESRGATLFELWANRYFVLTPAESRYREPWSEAEPTTTPRGLGHEANALAAFLWAVQTSLDRFGSWDVPWGEVHRIRAGELDIPVGGCASDLGCFRVIGFADDADGKFRARRGDAWVLAVEFGSVPRAYSVLVYGNSNREDSPYFYDQAKMFADNRMKSVAYSEAQIAADLQDRYRPGDQRGG